MKKTILSLPLYLLMATLTTFSFFSCGEKSGSQGNGDQSKIDSLENANTLGQMDNDYLRQSIAMLAEGLDSITAGENEVLNGENPELGGNRLTRQEMKEKLANVRDVLARHKDRIAELEKQLASAKESGSKEAKNLQTIITALRSQLDQKDKELEQLRADLDNSRKSIKEMAGKMEQMNNKMAEMENVQAEQSRTIEAQAEMMNYVYVKIGTKDELKDLGIVTGGNLLKKSKVDYSNINLARFDRKDKRKFTTIPLPKKYKIMTPQPASSYEVVNGQLRILNVEQFWNASNFLVIKID